MIGITWLCVRRNASFFFSLFHIWLYQRTNIMETRCSERSWKVGTHWLSVFPSAVTQVDKWQLWIELSTSFPKETKEIWQQWRCECFRVHTFKLSTRSQGGEEERPNRSQPGLKRPLLWMRRRWVDEKVSGWLNTDAIPVYKMLWICRTLFQRQRDKNRKTYLKLWLNLHYCTIAVQFMTMILILILFYGSG